MLQLHIDLHPATQKESTVWHSHEVDISIQLHGDARNVEPFTFYFPSILCRKVLCIIHPV